MIAEGTPRSAPTTGSSTTTTTTTGGDGAAPLADGTLHPGSTGGGTNGSLGGALASSIVPDLNADPGQLGDAPPRMPAHAITPDFSSADAGPVGHLARRLALPPARGRHRAVAAPLKGPSAMSQHLTYIRGGVHSTGEKGTLIVDVTDVQGASLGSFLAGSRQHLQFIAEDLVRIVKAQPDRLTPRAEAATEALLLMAADLIRAAKTWPL